MALIHGRVRGKKVEVTLAVDVPNMHALAALQHHGKRSVVVRAVLVLQVYQPLRRHGGARRDSGRGGAAQRRHWASDGGRGATAQS
jgi:hypothetical protein